MQYNAPPGSLDPDAPYVNGTPGQVKGSPVNAHAVEYPQREIINVINAAGFTPTNDELDQLLQAITAIIDSRIPAIPTIPDAYDISMTLDYFLCWHPFRGIHPTAKPGMVPVNGTLITDAATRYPQAFAYLQSAEGQQLCTTEALWQAANVAVWATLADGTPVGWDGIGGVCKYVIDVNAGTIRVPDLRGMTDEVAGDGSLGVGGVRGWGIPKIVGAAGIGGYTGLSYELAMEGHSGTFLPKGALGTHSYSASSRDNTFGGLAIDTSRVLPATNKVQTNAFGVLACVYLGKQAS